MSAKTTPQNEVSSASTPPPGVCVSLSSPVSLVSYRCRCSSMAEVDGSDIGATYSSYDVQHCLLHCCSAHSRQEHKTIFAPCVPKSRSTVGTEAHLSRFGPPLDPDFRAHRLRLFPRPVGSTQPLCREDEIHISSVL